MHISNERYFADRLRHDLALRMIHHEARTCTIRTCTGLTDDRIRRLYQTYATHMPAVPMRRHRGKSPRQIAFFTRNPRIQFEASLLAGLFVAFGLINAVRNGADPLGYGSLFCDVYETHVPALGLARGVFRARMVLVAPTRQERRSRPASLPSLRCAFSRRPNHRLEARLSRLPVEGIAPTAAQACAGALAAGAAAHALAAERC